MPRRKSVPGYRHFARFLASLGRKCHIAIFGFEALPQGTLILHCPPKVKVQPALLFSSFVHNSSINDLKNMKLIEHICYEMIN